MSQARDRLNRLWKLIRKHRIKTTLIGLYIITGIFTGTVIGQVMDAETGAPIEGAVIMVHWKWDWIPLPIPPEGGTIQMDSVTETVSRIGGRFTVIHPTLLIFAYPSVTVWNDSYVAWSSKYNFNGNNQWGSDRKAHPSRFGMTVPLKHWEENMGHCAQESFIKRQFSNVSDYNRGDIETPLMIRAKAREGDLCREVGGPYEERKKQ